MSESTKYLLPEDRIPKAWYNIAADLPAPLPPPLNPGTGQPIGPDDLSAIFPMALIGQEVSAEREIEIPEPVREVYKLWRPAPLYRARRLERALDTPARIFYKYEGVSPPGSHKPNTAVPQAFYNKEAGIKKLSTETGAGQWGSSLAFAGGLFGLEVKVFMVKVSYNQKPYRRALMETYGATCIASPSDQTDTGKAILAEHAGFTRQPRHRHFGSGGSGGQEPRHQLFARQRAQPRADPPVGDRHRGDRADGDGRPLARRGDRLRRRRLEFRRAHLPLPRQEAAREKGGAHHRRRAGGLSLADPRQIRLRLRRHRHLTPLVKMHTLGSTFIPPGFHAGGLRYHGMAPMVSHLKELDLIEARAVRQLPCFEAAVQFARAEGIVPAPEATHAIRVAFDEALRCKKEGKAETILFNLSGHGHFDMQAYTDYFAGKLEDRDYDEAELQAALAALPKVAA